VFTVKVGFVFVIEIDKANLQVLAHLHFAPMGWFN